MAIVFDTKAELEAFCEAFELRSIQQERPVRKARRKSNHIEKAIDIPEPVVAEPEKPQLLHIVTADEPEAVEAEAESPPAEVVDEPPLLYASAS